jgi:hypothetical protein
MRPRDSKIVLGGREFRPSARSTIRHDHWMMSRIRKAGITDIHQEPGEDARSYGLRVLDALLNGDLALELLGGVLVPADAKGPWTPEMAAETAAFVGGLEDPEDKRTKDVTLASLLIPFFARELASSTNTELPSDAAPGASPDVPEFARATASGAASSGFSQERT